MFFLKERTNVIMTSEENKIRRVFIRVWEESIEKQWETERNRGEEERGRRRKRKCKKEGGRRNIGVGREYGGGGRAVEELGRRGERRKGGVDWN